MKNEMITNDNLKGISNVKDELYLLNISNGRIIPWTPLNAVRPGFFDCNKDGALVDPKSIDGHHPVIMERTRDLRDRMVGAGANADTIYQMGQQLREDAEKKFSITDQTEKQYKLSGTPSAASTGFRVRVYNEIDKNVAFVKSEINRNVIKAKKRLGLL